jgi:hypothetical protein
MKGGGGFLLLVFGALGLIGFLSGNLDRWLAYLFTPSGTATPTAASSPVGTGAATSADRRPGATAIAGGLVS